MKPLIHQVVSGEVRLTVEEYGDQHRDSAAATTVFLPAMGVPLTYYRPMLERWAERKRHLLGVELRGMPQSPVAGFPRTAFGYRELVREDLPAVFGLEPIAPAPDVVLVGHSLGGHLAVLAAASGAVRASGVVTIGTGTSAASSQPDRVRRLKRRSQLAVVRAVVQVLGYWPGDRLGFGGRQPKVMMSDWAFEGWHGRSRLAGDPTDYQAALSAMTVPVLLLGLEGDQFVSPAALDQLAERLPGHATRGTISAQTVDAGRLDHFSWARRTPGLVIDEIETWLGALDL